MGCYLIQLLQLSFPRLNLLASQRSQVDLHVVLLVTIHHRPLCVLGVVSLGLDHFLIKQC